MGCGRLSQSLYDYCIKNGQKDLLRQWDKTANLPLTPETVASGSSRNIRWICEKGHTFVTTPCARIVRHMGCPICAGKRILTGYNDLKTLYPELMDEWNEKKNGALKPDEISPHTQRKAWWICQKCGYEWYTAVNNRTVPRSTGCPVCTGKITVPGINDLVTQFPEIAKRWHPTKNGELKPSMVTFGSRKKVWWVCQKGHKYYAAISSQQEQGGCPICAGKKTLAGFNDFASHYPELIQEWDYERNGDLKPDDVTVSCNKKVWWKCEKGHEWQAPVASRSSGRGCPYCKNRLVWQGYNDLASQFPDLEKEWNYKRNGDLTPDMVTYGSCKKVWWICAEGHEWQARIQTRTGPQRCGCRECYNDFARTGKSRKKKNSRN